MKMDFVSCSCVLVKNSRSFSLLSDENWKMFCAFPSGRTPLSGMLEVKLPGNGAFVLRVRYSWVPWPYRKVAETVLRRPRKRSPPKLATWL